MNKGVNFYVECSLDDRQIYFTLDNSFHWLLIEGDKEEVISESNWLQEVYTLFKYSVATEQLLFLADLDFQYNLALYDADLYFLVQQKCKKRKFYTYYINRLAEILDLTLNTTFAVKLPKLKITKVNCSSILLKKRRKLESINCIEEIYQSISHFSIFYLSKTKIVSMYGSLFSIKEWYVIDLSELDLKFLSYVQEIIEKAIAVM